MGVRVVPVQDALRAQLSLPDGTGLLVTDVAPHSPAAEAKLARFDVLTRINQQYLINPEQFEVLVRDAKPGQEVRLTVIRQAKLASVMVKLGSHKVTQGPMGQFTPEHAMPGAPMGPGWGHGMNGHTGPGIWGQGMRGGREGPNMPGGPMQGRPMPGGPMGPGWGHPMPGGPGPAMRGQGERNEEEENEAANEGPIHIEIREGKDGQPNVVVIPEGPDGRKGPAKRPGAAGQDRGDGYKGEMIFQSRENGELLQGFRDSEYALRLVTDRKGNKTLTARRVKDAEVVFEGPVNTPAERAKLPVPVRRRLEQIEKTPKFAPPPPAKQKQ